MARRRHDQAGWLLQQALIAALCLHCCQATACNLIVGIDAVQGEAAALQQFNLTFVQYLTEELGAKLGCSFTLQPFTSTGAVYSAVRQSQLAFMYANPSLHVCLESNWDASAVAAVVREIAGQEVRVQAGAAVVNASRDDLIHLTDIKGRRLSMAGLTVLNSGQSEWREMKSANVDPFGSSQQVSFIYDQTQQVRAVLNGSIDVALVSAEIPYLMQQAGQLQAQDLKVLSPASNPGFPFRASTRLYPQMVLSALPPANDTYELACWEPPFECFSLLTQCLSRRRRELSRLSAPSRAAVAGSYSYWTTPSSYVDVYEMQVELGLIVNGTCLSFNTDRETVYNDVLCPSGSNQGNAMQLNSSCSSRGIPCLPAATCVCDACKPIPSHGRQFGSLGIGGLASILAVAVLLLVALGIWGTARARGRGLAHIPFAELHITARSEVIGQGSYGWVLEGQYRGMRVCVTRLLPRGRCKLRSLFDIDGPTDVGGQLPPSAADDVLLQPMQLAPSLARALSTSSLPDPNTQTKGLPAQQLGSGHLSSPSVSLKQPLPSMPTATSSGLLSDPETGSMELAMLDQSSSPQQAHGEQQQQQQPLPLPWWRRRPPQRRKLGQRRRLRRSERRQGDGRRNAGGVVSCAVLWQRARTLAEWYRPGVWRQRQQVLSKTAALLQLRHPNIVTIMGTSTDPVTGDALVVEAFVERGTLYSILHNETVDVDEEMMLSLTRDVVAGMNFLHHAEPPMVQGELRSSKIMVDANCRAQLFLTMSDFDRQATSPEQALHAGAPFCMAPDVLSGLTPTRASDVYSFAILLYELLYRREAFEGEDPEDILLQLTGVGHIRHKRPATDDAKRSAGGVTSALHSIMEQCWQQDPALRPSFDTIEHELAAVSVGSGTDTLTTRRAREKALLEQMLPPKVAEALREGRPVEPEAFDCVTVFFSDVIGFADICAKLVPLEVMQMLDALYRTFDELTLRHELFKVETIGDAYMVVGNLRTPQPDHAARIALFAIQAVQAASNIMIREGDPTMGCITIRAGFHSGPVVASVVGNINPRLCLFGDTVNTASRMESSSLPGRIQMSRTTAQLLVRQRPDLRLLVSRRAGQLMVKGKGHMQTYWLHGRPTGDDSDTTSNATHSIWAGTSRNASQTFVQRTASSVSSGLDSTSNAGEVASSETPPQPPPTPHSPGIPAAHARMRSPFALAAGPSILLTEQSDGSRARRKSARSQVSFGKQAQLGSSNLRKSFDHDPRPPV